MALLDLWKVKRGVVKVFVFCACSVACLNRIKDGSACQISCVPDMAMPEVDTAISARLFLCACSALLVWGHKGVAGNIGQLILGPSFDHVFDVLVLALIQIAKMRVEEPDPIVLQAF
jgi:hypothetical protein